jgi:hypothetical protein
MVWLPWKSKKKALESTEKGRERQESNTLQQKASKEPGASTPSKSTTSTGKGRLFPWCKLAVPIEHRIVLLKSFLFSPRLCTPSVRLREPCIAVVCPCGAAGHVWFPRLIRQGMLWQRTSPRRKLKNNCDPTRCLLPVCFLPPFVPLLLALPDVDLGCRCARGGSKAERLVHCAHVAGYRGDTDKVEELIRLNANLHATDALGNSPLHLAAFNGHNKVIRWERKNYITYSCVCAVHPLRPA